MPQHACEPSAAALELASLDAILPQPAADGTAPDGKYAVSGAQPPEVLLELLRRAYDDASQLTPVEPGL